MATSFPGSLDALTNPLSTDTLNSPSHSGQHANANDAIEALQAKVGVDGSTVTTSLDYKIAQAATLNGIQTLTNKTLTAPAVNNALLSGTEESWVWQAGTPSLPAGGIVNLDLLSSTCYRFQWSSGSAGGYTLNLRGNSTTTLSSVLSPASATSGQSITVVVIDGPAGSSKNWVSAVQVDGVSQTILWASGKGITAAYDEMLASAGGYGCSIFTIIKRGDTGAYVVLGQWVYFRTAA